jgi:hypothetical protein
VDSLKPLAHGGAFPIVPRTLPGTSWCVGDLNMTKTRGVSHCGLAIYIKKYLHAKEELWKLKYFTMQKYNLQKIL